MTEDTLACRVAEAVARLRQGALVAYPTETLYGLGADGRSDAALAALARWKGRASDQPISVLVEDASVLPALGLAPSPAARRLAAAFWPGPLTLVLPAARPARVRFARGVARADGAVGVRCSPHPVARALAAALAASGVGPVTATSLNRSGDPPARSRAEARRLCADTPDAPWLLDDEAAPEPAGLPSTVVDCTEPTPRVLRAGAIPEDALRDVLAHANLPAEERP